MEADGPPVRVMVIVAPEMLDFKSRTDVDRARVPMVDEPMAIANRSRQITPPEAPEIAASLAAAGRHVKGEADELRAARSLLEQTWAGRASERFLLDSERLPGDLEALASLLGDDHAQAVATITVTIWEGALVPLSQAWE